MPCLILTGHPCSGKTTLARVIRRRALRHTSGRIQRVVIVNEEESLVYTADDDDGDGDGDGKGGMEYDRGAERSKYYASSHSEKSTRSSLKAAFDRAIAEALATTTKKKNADDCDNDDGDDDDDDVANKKADRATLIIVDSLNYIKGYRYELHCISKSAGEQHGVVWVLNDIDTAREWNRRRRDEAALRLRRQRRRRAGESDGDANDEDEMDASSLLYGDDLFDELIQRYEPPDDRNRWDKPLYRIDMRPSGDRDAANDATKEHNGGNEGGSTGLPELHPMSLLEKSVYNMHNLREQVVLDGVASSTATMMKAQPSDVTGTTKTKKKKKTAASTFKRAAAGKKKASRPAPSASSDCSAQASTSITTPAGPLTAEALSALSNANGNVGDRHEVFRGDDSDNVAGSGAARDADAKASAPRRGEVARATTTAAAAAPQPHRTLEERVDRMLMSFLNTVQPLKEGTSTRQHLASHADALNDVDSITMAVCRAILAAAASSNAKGGTDGFLPVVLSGKECELSLNNRRGGGSRVDGVHGKGEVLNDGDMDAIIRELGKSKSELHALRRRYIQWMSTNPPNERDLRSEYGLAQSFLYYVIEIAAAQSNKAQTRREETNGPG